MVLKISYILFPQKYVRTTFAGLLFLLSVQLSAQVSPSGRALDTSKQLTQFMLDSWTTENGLPHNSVMDQVKTRKGYFWLVTFDGLARFDGVRTKVFNQQNTPAFGTNSLLSVIEDQSGTLWIGTNGKGIIRFAGDSFSIPAFNHLLPNPVVTSFAQGPDGRMWIGTRAGLACVKDGKILPVPEELQFANVFSLDVSQNGTLWAGTLGQGLWKYNNSELQNFTVNDGLKSNSVRAVLVSENGLVWIGTEDGLCTYSRSSGISGVGPELRTFINSLTEDNAGTIWAGTDQGLLRYSNGKTEVLAVGEDYASDAVQHVFSDGEGSLWMGTYHHGLLRLRDGRFRNFTIKEGLPNPIANVVLPDATGVWIGTDNGLVFVRDDGTVENITIGKDALSNRIRDIIFDRQGDLLVGTYGGLYHLKQGEFHKIKLAVSYNSDKRIRRLLQDADGNIWIGTNSGLYLLEKGTEGAMPKPVALENTYIMALYSDQNQKVWTGTNGAGIYTFHNGKSEPFPHNDKLPSGVVFDIFKDRKGQMWFLTNNGISLYSGDSLISVDERKGLFANTLFQMLQDFSGSYWVTTNKGIFKIKESSLQNLLLKGEPIKHADQKFYTRADGLFSSEITPSSRSARTEKGHFWFTTLQGVSSIEPLKETRNSKPPKVLMEKAMADQEQLPMDLSKDLSPDTRYFEFYFTALNYYAPNATRFRYRLENFEEVWHEAGSRREAWYTNLPAGSYTFQVMAVNEDGIWSEEPATFSFTKKPHFYKQVWFIVLAVVLFASFAALIYFMRVRKLVDQNEKLNNVIDKRTAHIKAQRDAIEGQKEELGRLNGLKDKLLSIISHDLRGPLSSTMGILNLFNQRQISEEELRQFSGDLSQYVGQQVNMLDNLLNWSRSQMQGFEVKPVQVNIFQMAEETIIHLRQDWERKNLRIENLLDPEIYIMADQNLLQLVIRNLLMNAIKFTNDHGLISISSAVKNSMCQIEVADNGTGMTKEQLADVFRSEKLTAMRGTFNDKGTGLGLAICKEFVEKWGGKIWAESYFGKGSRFKFTISTYTQSPVYEEELKEIRS